LAHGDAGRVETREDANDSMADADMEDEYAQSPPAAEGVLPDADMEDEYAQSPPAAEGVVHDAAISHDAGHGVPMHTEAPPPPPKSNLRRGSRAQGVKKRLRSDDAEEASKKARRTVKPAFLDPEKIAALAQQRLAQQRLAAPQPPPAAPQPPPAAPQPPPAGAWQAQGPGQEQNNAGEQRGSALTGATFGVRSAGVQSAWKPSF